MGDLVRTKQASPSLGRYRHRLRNWHLDSVFDPETRRRRVFRSSWHKAFDQGSFPWFETSSIGPGRTRNRYTTVHHETRLDIRLTAALMSTLSDRCPLGPPSGNP